MRQKELSQYLSLISCSSCLSLLITYIASRTPSRKRRPDISLLRVRSSKTPPYYKHLTPTVFASTFARTKGGCQNRLPWTEPGCIAGTCSANQSAKDDGASSNQEGNGIAPRLISSRFPAGDSGPSTTK